MSASSHERRKRERRQRRIAKREAREAARLALADDDDDRDGSDDEEHSHHVAFRRTAGGLVRLDAFEPDPGDWSPSCAAERLALRLDREFFEAHPDAGRRVRPSVVGECPGAAGTTHVIVVELERGGNRVRFAFRSEDGSGAVPPQVARDVERMVAELGVGACFTGATTGSALA